LTSQYVVTNFNLTR